MHQNHPFLTAGHTLGDGTFDRYITVGMVETGDLENGLFIISTANRLFYVIENDSTLNSGLVFSIIY